MAYLLAPTTPDPDLPVFFNVDGVVGAAPAQNLREDVLLVQFALFVLGKAPLPTTNPDTLAAARAVQVTGNMDPGTITAIRVVQGVLKTTYPAQVVDGRVSPAKGYNYGGGVWTIAKLNNFLQDRYADVWPRIDQIPGCPLELKQMVNRKVVGE